jgi:hypothetical protein
MTLSAKNAPSEQDFGWVKIRVERGPGKVTKGKWTLVAVLPNGRTFERPYHYKHDALKEVLVPSFDLVDVPSFLTERVR